MPLKFDSTRSNEPFLQLPPPYQNIIITAPRRSDGPRVVECMNDERVYSMLNGPPFPYTDKDFEFWFDKIHRECAKGLQQYLDMTSNIPAADNSEGPPVQRKWCDTVPVRGIREIDPVTGAQEFIGDVGFDRQGYQGDTSMTPEQQQEQRQLNENYGAGD